MIERPERDRLDAIATELGLDSPEKNVLCIEAIHALFDVQDAIARLRRLMGGLGWSGEELKRVGELLRIGREAVVFQGIVDGQKDNAA